MKKIMMMITAVFFCVILLTPAVTEAKKLNSAEDAKKLACNKVKGADVTGVDTDYDNGKLMYEVSMIKGSREYGLDYRASDGKLLKYEWEINGSAGASNGKRMSKSQIKKQAKKDVKNAKITQIVLDVDDGVEEYKVTMKKGSKTYRLVYNASSGKQMEYQWKISGSSSSSSNSTSSNSKYIGEDKAKSIAMDKVPGGTVTKLEFDKDDGVPVYEIEMTKGSQEYELTIHAETGKILEYDYD